MMLTFVIPALNEARVLPDCLRAIKALNKPDDLEVEIIVVDNKSTDGTPDLAREAGASIVTTDPGIISRARNLGAAEAKGTSWVSSTRIAWFPRIGSPTLLPHFENEKVLAAGSSLMDRPAQAPWVERIWFELAHHASDPAPRNVQWLSTQNLIVRKNAFDRLGGFNEKLVTCEDADLGYRLSAEGEVILDGRVPYEHLGESKTLGVFFRPRPGEAAAV